MRTPKSVAPIQAQSALCMQSQAHRSNPRSIRWLSAALSSSFDRLSSAPTLVLPAMPQTHNTSLSGGSCTSLGRPKRQHVGHNTDAPSSPPEDLADAEALAASQQAAGREPPAASDDDEEATLSRGEAGPAEPPQSAHAVAGCPRLRSRCSQMAVQAQFRHGAAEPAARGKRRQAGEPFLPTRACRLASGRPLSRSLRLPPFPQVPRAWQLQLLAAAASDLHERLSVLGSVLRAERVARHVARLGRLARTSNRL